MSRSNVREPDYVRKNDYVRKTDNVREQMSSKVVARSERMPELFEDLKKGSELVSSECSRTRRGARKISLSRSATKVEKYQL